VLLPGVQPARLDRRRQRPARYSPAGAVAAGPDADAAGFALAVLRFRGDLLPAGVLAAAAGDRFGVRPHAAGHPRERGARHGGGLQHAPVQAGGVRAVGRGDRAGRRLPCADDGHRATVEYRIPRQRDDPGHDGHRRHRQPVRLAAGRGVLRADGRLAVGAVAALAVAAGHAADRGEPVHAQGAVGPGRALVAGAAARRRRAGRGSRIVSRAVQPILQATGVIKRYGKFTALAGVDLAVLPRTVHSVIGPNGAGKTTLFHMLTGTVPVSEGRIVFNGRDVTHAPDHVRVRHGIARSFQVTSLFNNLSVRENLRLAVQGAHPSGAFDAWRRPDGPRAHAEL